MAIGISDLFRYKKKVQIKNGDTVEAEVWMRILGDYDIQQAYKQSRIVSARKRLALRTPGTDDYEDYINPLPDQNSREDAINLIKTSKITIYVAEAYATINREDPPRAIDVAVEPDAVSLEENEKLDNITDQQDITYNKKIREHVEDRIAELEQELAEMEDGPLYDMAKFEVSNILASQEFQDELSAQKVFRATYLDEKCKTRAFLDLEDYKTSHVNVKAQLIAAYESLELSPGDIKN